MQKPNFLVNSILKDNEIALSSEQNGLTAELKPKLLEVFWIFKIFYNTQLSSLPKGELVYNITDLQKYFD